MVMHVHWYISFSLTLDRMLNYLDIVVHQVRPIPLAVMEEREEIIEGTTESAFAAYRLHKANGPTAES